MRAALALVRRADKILVGAAIASVAGKYQTVLAAAAANRALQIVAVLTITLTAQGVGFQYGLDLLEQLLANQRLVPTGIDLGAHAYVKDNPLNYIDPAGEWGVKKWKAVANWILLAGTAVGGVAIIIPPLAPRLRRADPHMVGPLGAQPLGWDG
jgi:hypothetical protein